MTNQEQQLIEAIKAMPGHQVLMCANGGSVHVVRSDKNRVGQLSVWLGRRNTIEHLQRILAAASGFNAPAIADNLRALGYHCVIDGVTVIVQDPVYVTSGAAAGRFVEFKAVTLRTDAEARRFINDRS